jgi:hypothetical protein
MTTRSRLHHLIDTLRPDSLAVARIVLAQLAALDRHRRGRPLSNRSPRRTRSTP